jgi:hypothetical protein
MSDSFDVSARVWPVVVGGVEVGRVIALDGLVVVHQDSRKSAILAGKLEVAYFMRQVLEADSEGVEGLIEAVDDATRAAFDMPLSFKREPKSKDELQNWLNASLGHANGFTVKAQDLRLAWNEYYNLKHGCSVYWTPQKFHARLRELGYTVARASVGEGTCTNIMNVFMRKGRPRRPSIPRTTPATTTPPPAGATP